MRMSHAVLVMVALLAALPSFAYAQDASHRCEEYATQDEAQAAFDRDPERMWELDDDGDGVACEHLPPAAGDGASIFPWIAGGVLVLGAAAGVVLARRRSSSPAPEPSAEPQELANIHLEYDPEVELELELIRAERDAAEDGSSHPPEGEQRA